MGPDTRYIPVMKRGSKFASSNGAQFVLTENIDFSAPRNPVIVARTDTSTGAPTYYAIKAYGNVVSGFFSSQNVTIKGYERFKRVALRNTNIAEIVSVFDSEGNEYYEVDYLSQDLVYKEIPNNNFRSDNVPSIIKPHLVSRKFVSQSRSSTYLLQHLLPIHPHYQTVKLLNWRFFGQQIFLKPNVVLL